MDESEDGDKVSRRLADDVEALNQAASLLGAMANPKRLQMLMLLSQDEMSAGHLTKEVRLDQSAASQHLAKLRAAGLVETRREAQQIFYICRSDKVSRLLVTLADIGNAQAVVRTQKDRS